MNENIAKKNEALAQTVIKGLESRNMTGFYAASKEEAYDKFVKWMAERQLHEDKSKTTIVELSSEGIDGRDMNEIK